MRPKEQSVAIFEKLIAYDELSDLLSVPKGTLQDWVFKRKIPFKKIQGQIRFKPSEILRWIEEGNTNGH